MTQLPQFEPRPTASYYLGQSLARGCLTSSLLLNGLRLSALALAAPYLALAFVGRGSLLIAMAGVMLLTLTFLWRPRSVQREGPVETWTVQEQRMRQVVEQSLAADSPLAPALQAAALVDELTIDYGMSVEERRPVCVAPSLRQAHQLVIGGSGSGKSKFLATQAAQALLLGRTIAVVDPHEELAQDVVCSAAPLLAARGCVILWPGSDLVKRVYPWNPLWTGVGREPWQAADGVVAAVKRVWELSDANTYIIDVLKHTMWALAAAGWTLLEGARFLREEPFRHYIAEQSGVTEVRQWVAALDAMTTRDRMGICQTTLVRLNRLNANPHLQRLLGCGVTDPRYRTALSAAGITPIDGADLVADINRGLHLFAVLPRRALGEDQYVVAGLVQSALLSAALSRRPNDPTMPELEVYLDEAGAYANAEGLGVLLAQARKYRFSATVAMQGLGQAEGQLADELERNTAIKVVFTTDQVDELRRAAEMLFHFTPTAVKIDARQKLRVGPNQERREIGAFQTYGVDEQRAFYAGQIGQLPFRTYYLKVRDAPETPLLVRTPDYTARFSLEEALRLVRRRRSSAWATIDAIEREYAFRQAWLNERRYQGRPVEVPLPSFVAETQEACGHSSEEAALTFGGDDG